VETDGVDAVLVGGVEQEVAGQLPGGALGYLRQREAGAFEVEQQSVDGEVVGVDGDAGAKGLQRAVGGLVESGGDVGHQVAVRELKEPGEGEGAQVPEGGLGEPGPRRLFPDTSSLMRDG
jgi:hypothetical protein